MVQKPTYDDLKKNNQRLEHLLSHQKKIENSLRSSIEMYLDFYENAPDMFVSVSSEDASIIECNKTLCKNLGYEKKELVGQSIFMVYPQEKHSEIKVVFNKFKATGEVNNAELQLVRKDGSLIDVILNVTAVRDDKGKILYSRSIWRDVSDLKKAHSETSKLEKRYKILYESSVDAIVYCNMDGRLLDPNKAFCHMLGYSREEICLLSFQEITPEKWHPMEDEIIKKQILPRGFSDEYEKEYIKKDGTIVPISMQVWLLKDEKGKPFQMWAIIRDISERKQSEKKLKDYQQNLEEMVERRTHELRQKKTQLEKEIQHREVIHKQLLRSKEEWENTFDTIPDMILLIDNNFKIVNVNQAVCNNLGKQRKELIGNTCYETIHGTREPPNQCPHVKTNDTLKPAVNEFFDKKLDGYFLFSTTPILDKHKKVTGIVEVIHDISNRKRIEDDLRESEEKSKAILDNSMDGTILMDHDGIISYFNPAAEKIFDFLQQEVTGRKLHDLLVSHQAKKEYHKRLPEFGKTGKCVVTGKKMEVFATKKDGSRFPLELTVSAFKLNENWHSVGTFRDITERKVKQKALQEYADKQDVLFREVNHRVKNNLAVIISMLHKEVDRIDAEFNPEDFSPLQELEKRIRGLLSAHNLLSASNWKPLSLSLLCNKVLKNMMLGVSKEKMMKIRVIPSHILVSSDQAHNLALIINEIGTNSLKYGAVKGCICELMVTSFIEDEIITLVFQDTGPGFPITILNDPVGSGNVGYDLIHGIVEKSLRGNIVLTNHNGAVVTITFQEGVKDVPEINL